jgi:hypothetical protein
MRGPVWMVGLLVLGLSAGCRHTQVKQLPGARIGGRLYVTKHRVFGRYDRIFLPEGGAMSVPFCGILLDARWDKDGEGLIAYPSPMKGFSVVQDNTGVILVVDKYP